MVRGAFPLFRVSGIQVYLHFTWFLVAWFEISSMKGRYHSPMWPVLEYCGLFGLVLAHEFGHAFACRSTGGRADQIVLWPLGGLAFVDPPPRPTAVLWSIVAGPLVNVVLFPCFFFVLVAAKHGWLPMSPDARRVIFYLWITNTVLLVFNLLPFYPLDGGQIVRALLWFKVGPIRSLFISGCIGMAGAVFLGCLALYWGSIWTGVIAFFLFGQAGNAVQRVKEMRLAAEIAERPSAPPPPPVPSN
jgi:Zn-dependent protease